MTKATLLAYASVVYIGPKVQKRDMYFGTGLTFKQGEVKDMVPADTADKMVSRHPDVYVYADSAEHKAWLEGNYVAPEFEAGKELLGKGAFKEDGTGEGDEGDEGDDKTDDFIAHEIALSKLRTFAQLVDYAQKNLGIADAQKVDSETMDEARQRLLTEWAVANG